MSTTGDKILTIFRRAIERLFLGLALFLLLYLIFLPFLIVISVRPVFLNWYHLLLLVVFATLFGELMVRFRLPLLGRASRGFLSLMSGVYGNFLKQAARYFCADNVTDPFETVVLVRLSNGLEVLGFSTHNDSRVRTIFVPTSPNPTSGFIIRVDPDLVVDTDITRDEFLKYTLTSGVHVLNIITTNERDLREL